MKQQDEKTTFLKRWSERKLEADQQQVTQTADASATREEIQLKTDADMPPLESLTQDSDFSDFLSPGVSDALRKAALRKLFHMPHLNVVDGLDDYAEDFTSFEALGDVVTQYDRYMSEVKEKSRLAEEQAAERQQSVEEDVEDVQPDEEELFAEQPGAQQAAGIDQDITVESMKSVNEQQHS